MYVTIALIILTAAISIKGFKTDFFTEKYAFDVDKIQLNSEYYRMLTSGFLHISWMHLLINMFVLFSFGSGLEAAIGWILFLAIYFISMAGGNLLAFIIHKHHPFYTSVGASGAISGLVFATITLMPQMKILFIPGWVFGILYVIYALYAIRSERRDVGHAAHLGGGLVGMALAILFFPGTIQENWIPVVGIFVPAVTLLLIMIYRPDWIVINKKDKERQMTMDDKFYIEKQNTQYEIDKILEKINDKGIKSLSKKERQLLENYSKSSS